MVSNQIIEKTYPDRVFFFSLGGEGGAGAGGMPGGAPGGKSSGGKGPTIEEVD